MLEFEGVEAGEVDDDDADVGVVSVVDDTELVDEELLVLLTDDVDEELVERVVVIDKVDVEVIVVDDFVVDGLVVVLLVVVLNVLVETKVNVVNFVVDDIGK